MRSIILISVVLLSACASTKESSLPDRTYKQLTSYAQTLIGSPYKYGGKSPSTGFDCSGYVGHVFKNIAGISLPHNSRQISRHGKSVKASQLREGDLVFYDTNNQSFSHVGIYLGNERFIHAPSSGGSVRVEDMNMDYWKKHYNGARRINVQN